MNIHVCDRCEKRIEKIKIRFFEIEEIPYYVISRGNRGRWELCSSCNKIFSKTLYKFLQYNKKGEKE